MQHRLVWKTFDIRDSVKFMESGKVLKPKMGGNVTQNDNKVL